MCKTGGHQFPPHLGWVCQVLWTTRVFMWKLRCINHESAFVFQQKWDLNKNNRKGITANTNTSHGPHTLVAICTGSQLWQVEKYGVSVFTEILTSRLWMDLTICSSAKAPSRSGIFMVSQQNSKHKMDSKKYQWSGKSLRTTQATSPLPRACCWLTGRQEFSGKSWKSPRRTASGEPTQEQSGPWWANPAWSPLQRAKTMWPASTWPRPMEGSIVVVTPAKTSLTSTKYIWAWTARMAPPTSLSLPLAVGRNAIWTWIWWWSEGWEGHDSSCLSEPPAS